MTRIHTNLFVAAVGFAAACGAQGAEEVGIGGLKADGEETAAAKLDPLVTCNGGDMTIGRRQTNNAYGQYELTITDSGVVEWYESQLAAPACADSYYGGTACVEKRMPWTVQISGTAGDKKLVITSMTEDSTNAGSYYASQGTSIRRAGTGYDVTIGNQGMPNSHTQIVYTIGNWYFESCEAVTAPAPAGEAVTTVAQ